MAGRSDLRDFDLAVVGATGTTGRLVTRYLARHPETRGLNIALAGRSGAGLGRLLDELQGPLEQRFTPVRVDLLRRRDTQHLAACTRVVCTAAGPFSRLGGHLMASCARRGTDYCDVAGELPWLRDMIDRHSNAAKSSGARIVSACGFDAVVADLGCLMLWDRLKKARANDRPEASESRRPRFRVDSYLETSRGPVSSASARSTLLMLGDPRTASMFEDPYCLVPESRRLAQPRRSSHIDAAVFDPKQRGWLARTPIAPIDTAVVHRTNVLLGHPYGRRFRFREAALFEATPHGRLSAAAQNAFWAWIFAESRSRSARRGMTALGSAPNHAPLTRPEGALPEGFFSTRLAAHATETDGTVTEVRGRVHAHLDPGYRATAVMVAESALSLLNDQPSTSGGLWTPASALGGALLRRLVRSGISFEVIDSPKKRSRETRGGGSEPARDSTAVA